MLGKTRDEWCALMEHTDVCFAPVLTMSEAAAHPHNVEPVAPSSRWPACRSRHRRRGSRAPCRQVVDSPPAHPGQHSPRVLADWGIAGRPHRRAARVGAVGRRLMGTLVCFHAHPDDESDQHRRLDGPRRRRRAIAWCWWWPPTATTARCPTISRRGRDLGRPSTRRERRLGRGARCAPCRVAELRRQRHDRLGPERARAFVPAGTAQRGGRQAGGDPARGAAADVLTTYDWHGNYGHPDHIKVHTRRPSRRRARRHA
jgi:hypothetical protein